MSYLRTNYRRTGGQVDITAIGGGYPLASAQNGVGTPLAYGGFIYVKSYVFSFSTPSAAHVGDSTAGLMSFYYGSGQFGNGYKFLPLGFLVRSGKSNLSDGASAWYAASMPVVWQPTWSSSIWMIRAFALSDSILVTLSDAHFLVDVYGFIVSSP